jgi:hypothetical protein
MSIKMTNEPMLIKSTTPPYVIFEGSTWERDSDKRIFIPNIIRGLWESTLGAETEEITFHPKARIFRKYDGSWQLLVDRNKPL